MKQLVHKFRNALVIAIETQSHKFCSLDRWNELNTFPKGSCDIASNMLAYYLKKNGYDPKIIFCQNSHPRYPSIHGHAWVEVDDKFIDITISQFPEYNSNRVYITPKKELNMLKEIYEYGNDNQTGERPIDLRTGNSSGQKLYDEIEKIANSL